MEFNEFHFICIFNLLHKQVFLAGRTHNVERFSFEFKSISSSPDTDIQVMSTSASRYFTPKQYRVAAFAGRVLTQQLKFKLDNRCSNNRAEQLAIVKALEVRETQQVNHNEQNSNLLHGQQDNSGLIK